MVVISMDCPVLYFTCSKAFYLHDYSNNIDHVQLLLKKQDIKQRGPNSIGTEQLPCGTTAVKCYNKHQFIHSLGCPLMSSINFKKIVLWRVQNNCCHFNFQNDCPQCARDDSKEARPMGWSFVEKRTSLEPAGTGNRITHYLALLPTEHLNSTLTKPTTPDLRMREITLRI